MINRLTKYIFIEQIKPFLFFLGVMAGIIWLVKSLPSLEYVIEYNQSGLIFIQVVLYILPTVLLVVVPFAAMAATTFTLNRLLLEAELITIMNSGLTNFRLLRPFLLFSITTSIILFILVFYLAPNSQRNLRTIMHEVGNNIQEQMMKIKRFYSPTADIHVYIGQLSENGILEDILITDERDENLSITYSANSGNMIIDGSNIELEMKNGTIQNYSKREDTLVLTNFSLLKLNISESLVSNTSPEFGPSEMSPLEMINKSKTLSGTVAKKYIGEAHLRLVLIITPISLCIFSFSLFLLVGYRRRGYSLLTFLIFFYGTCMQSATFASKSLFLSEKIYWQVIYMPTLFTLVFSIAVIKWVSTTLKPILIDKKLIYS